MQISSTRRASIKQKTKVSSAPCFKLSELRELVEATKDFDGESSVVRYQWVDRDLKEWNSMIEIVEMKEQL